MKLYPSMEAVGRLRGRFLRTENGRDAAHALAFSRDSLVGLHLLLPRALGVTAVYMTLTADTGEGAFTLPIPLSGCERGSEKYVALLDGHMLPDGVPLFLLTFTLESPYGTLSVCGGEEGEVFFSADAPPTAFPLLFAQAHYPYPDWLSGGTVYLLSADRIGHTASHFLGKEGSLDRFFAYLASLGVRALWLLPPQDPGAEREVLSVLTPAVLALGERWGIRFLCDLLWLFGMRENGRLQGGEARPGEDPFGEEIDSSLALHGMSAPLEKGEEGLSPALLGGEGGLLSRAARAGFGGYVLRCADCFGDAFLTLIREEIGKQANAPVLLGGAAPAAPGGIAFGVRRRFLFGKELDGLASYALREALLSYLGDGRTEALSTYLLKTLPAMPPAARNLSLHLLESGECGAFLSVLSERCRAGERAVEKEDLIALYQLACLMIATLPGIPALIDPGESGPNGWDAMEEGERTGEAGQSGTLAFLLRLFALRRRESVFRDGSFRLLTLTPTLLAFSREREGEALVTVVNRSAVPLRIAAEESFFVLLGGRGRKQTYLLPPFSGTVLRCAVWEGESPHFYLRPAPVVHRDTRFTTHGVGEKSS